MFIREALLWEKKNDGVRCKLCNRFCFIPKGSRGNCGVRENRDGKLFTLVYGRIVSAAVDPIEKKPLFHFFPGSRVLSFATVGCNFHCLHCQNWEISQAKPEDLPSRYMSPEDAIELANSTKSDGLAYTYVEPTIFFEWAQETAKLGKEKGLYNVFITNGYFSEYARRELKKTIDAMNIDVKAFSDRFYKEVCVGASLEPVLENVEHLFKRMHVEVTYLIIPGLNDSDQEIKDFCFWASGVSEDLVVHFSRFYPAYKMLSRPITPVATLERARKIAEDAGLRYVYTGNVPGHEGENTYCPNCGALLVKRFGFRVLDFKIERGKCPYCNFRIRGVWHASHLQGWKADDRE